MAVNDNNFSTTKSSAGGEIILVCRRDMSITSVIEVINFDEESVRLRTSDGELLIEGTDIKIGTLDTECGVVKLTGNINGIYYVSEPSSEKKGFFAKLLR